MANVVFKGVLVGLAVGVLFFPTGCTKKVDTAKSPISESKSSESVTSPSSKESPAETVEEKEILADTKPVPAPKMETSESLLADVYFDFDQSGIRDDAQKALDENAKRLQKESGSKIVLEGHCDERGTSEYNLALGEKRAQAVKRYLASLGVAAARLQTVSYGEEKPVCTEADESCYQKNRRVHFAIE